MKKSINSSSWWALTASLIFVLAFLTAFSPKGAIQLGPTDGTTTQLDFEGNKIGQLTEVNLIIDYDDNPNVPFIDIIQGIPIGFSVVYEGVSTPRPDLQPYFPGTNPIQFTKFPPLQDETLNYVIIADKETACPSLSGNALEIDSLYLAPPEESREITLGETELIISEPAVIRTVSKDEVNINGEVTAYLHIYPGCESSYSLVESIPAGWSIIDNGGGAGGTQDLTWTKDCSPNICENEVISYTLQAPSIIGGPTIFTGNYEIPDGSGTTIQYNTNIPIRNLDCSNPTNCNNEAACQGEYSNAQQTETCFNFESVPSCTGRAGYYCNNGCALDDVRYIKGDPECGVGEICCQDIPEQTCEESGGYCFFDETSPTQTCPGNLEREHSLDITCNNDHIPEGTENHAICCITQTEPQQTCESLGGRCNTIAPPGSPDCGPTAYGYDGHIPAGDLDCDPSGEVWCCDYNPCVEQTGGGGYTTVCKYTNCPSYVVPPGNFQCLIDGQGLYCCIDDIPVP